MSRNVIKLSEEEKQKQADEAYMMGRPNRLEMSNYVNALMEQHYFPELAKMTQSSQVSMQIGFMVLQAIMINKGICTGEEIEELTQQFLQQFQKDSQQESKDVE